MCDDCLASLRSLLYPSEIRSIAVAVLERGNHFHFFYASWLRNTDDLPTPVVGVPIL